MAWSKTFSVIGTDSALHSTIICGSPKLLKTTMSARFGRLFTFIEYSTAIRPAATFLTSTR